MESPELVEDGLLLRPWKASDADAVHRACQDPEIQRWTTVPAPYLPEHAVQFVTERAPKQWTDGTGAPFAACDATTGELLASCGLVTLTPGEATGEIGYWTAPWARGRGVAVRATRAVARWAFAERGLHRLVWQAEVGNHASRLVALRAGFRVEGQLRLAHPHPRGGRDAWVGSLLPDEVPPPGTPADGTGGPAGPGSLVARRAAVFGRPQPVLFAATPETELSLRPPAEQDLDAMVAACRDPEAQRWIPLPDPYHRSDAEAFLTKGLAAWRAGTAACFVVAGPDDGYLGALDLRIAPGDPLIGEVGFMIAPQARGRGYLPAALTAVAAWGFATLGLARIDWYAQVGNTASRRAAEKAGFVMVGTVRSALDQRGTRRDAWLGSLLPGDLRMRQDP
ncbi:GNAT family N-acetyltransferase [Plantactinospora sp. GCM10030261]|uniref:GNAT family N-acetyltransferase n=1 Tax=Plantactinospora sp. GCM10030261 TaxID=3273420 RepID=UPI0036220D5D